MQSSIGTLARFVGSAFDHSQTTKPPTSPKVAIQVNQRKLDKPCCFACAIAALRQVLGSVQLMIDFPRFIFPNDRVWHSLREALMQTGALLAMG